MNTPLGAIVAVFVTLGEPFVGVKVGVCVSKGIGVSVSEAVAVKALLGDIVGVFVVAAAVSVGVLVKGVFPMGAGVLVIVSVAVIVGVMLAEGGVPLGGLVGEKAPVLVGVNVEMAVDVNMMLGVIGSKGFREIRQFIIIQSDSFFYQFPTNALNNLVSMSMK